MGTVREVDAIGNAIIETDREIAGSAWDQEDTELEGSGDRSMEDMGDGLEGQHEAEDETDVDGEDADGEEESEAEGEVETAEAEAAAAAAAAATGKGKEGEGEKPEAGRTEGRVPSGKLREANEALRAAVAERDELKAKIEKTGGENKSLADKLDLVMREINDLKRSPRGEVKPPEPPKPETIPDIFEDPKGFADHITKGFETKLSERDQQMATLRVETSMAIAHAVHKDTFEKAFEGLNKLDPRNPDDRTTVQRIYNSPNPGEALVTWHKRAQTLAEVGDDPTAFRERVREETRQALLKDPEFRKQIVADLRGEAARPGPDGNPRTTTRLPPALNRASGSNLGTGRDDTRGGDDSEQSVADAAWR